MANVAHEPVKKAMSRIRELSADEEARRLAFVRERALHDEVSQLNEARREGEKKGEQIGLQKGEQRGLKKGEQLGLQKGEQRGAEKTRLQTARNMIAQTDMDDATIADISGLDVSAVAALRAQLPS